MADVFISYCNKDIASAEYLLNTLESMYLTCWMAPRDIPKGDNFADKIPSAIRNAKVFLILVSQNSQSSVQVQNELNFATHTGLPRLSIRLDDAPLTNIFQYHLPKENQIEANGRLVAAARELVTRIHQEIKNLSHDTEQNKDNRYLHTVAPMIWVVVVAGCAALLICVSCICLSLQIITLNLFLKNLGIIIPLALLAAALVRTPLFSEKNSFYQTILKLLKILRNKK